MEILGLNKGYSGIGVVMPLRYRIDAFCVGKRGVGERCLG